MTNEEKYKTAIVRHAEYKRFCEMFKREGCSSCPAFGSGACAFKWLELEAANESPEPCPFCGKETEVIHISYDNCFAVKCYKGCGYISAHTCSENGAVANHNKLCHKLKEGESK